MQCMLKSIFSLVITLNLTMSHETGGSGQGRAGKCGLSRLRGLPSIARQGSELEFELDRSRVFPHSTLAPWPPASCTHRPQLAPPGQTRSDIADSELARVPMLPPSSPGSWSPFLVQGQAVQHLCPNSGPGTKFKGMSEVSVMEMNNILMKIKNIKTSKNTHGQQNVTILNKDRTMN